jgi:RNA polymerase sigma-70 factor (ECF subfamily)
MRVCEPAAVLAAVSDDDVMVCVKAGSVGALGVLYGRYRDRAYRVAWSVCRDAGRAEEAVQEAFISIWKARMTYDPQVGKVAAWVLTVVRYRAIDIARRNARHAEHRVSEDILRAARGPNNVAEQVEDRAQARGVLSLLAGLPDAQREVITLAFYGELTHSEIASYLGLPAGTVKGRMRLGLQRLRGELESVADERRAAPA